MNTRLVNMPKVPKLTSSNWDIFSAKLMEHLHSNAGLGMHILGKRSHEDIEEEKSKEARLLASRQKGEAEALLDAIKKDIEIVRVYINEEETKMVIEGSQPSERSFF